MANTVSLFRGTSGLSNKTDPARLKASKTGMVELAEAINIVIDDTGRTSRRRGSTRVATGSWHSLHDCGQFAAGVTGDALSVINKDYSTTAIRRVTPGARVSYETAHDWTFYGNGFESGYLKDKASYPWVMPSIYLGQESTEVWMDPPVGHLISRYKARMLIAVETYLYVSRAQDFFRFSEVYYPFPDRIKMIRPVQHGIFIGTTQETYFLRGNISTTAISPFEKIKVADYGVIEGTDLIIPGGRVGDGSMGAEVGIWTSDRGVCVGTSDGGFFNLTEDKLVLPDAQFGTAVYKDGTYLVLIEP